MKLIPPLIAAIFAIALSSCGKAHSNSDQTEHAPENGAQFRKGEGLALTDEMKQAIGLQIVEVAEAKVAEVFVVALRVLPASDLQPATVTSAPGASSLATGWITAAQASRMQLGMAVDLHSANDGPLIQPGSITHLEKTAYAVLGDFEVTITTATPLPQGTPILATFRASAREAVLSIPLSSLLRTAAGTFAYTVNGEFYLRTPVKVGAMNDQLVEIIDGLYAGDEIVASPVMSLWMAELQVLRGGKACTCGH